MVKLWRLVCCVDSCNHSKLRLFPHFKSKLYTDFMSIYILFEQNSDISVGLAEFFIGKNTSVMVFNWSLVICSIQTWSYIIYSSCLLGSLINHFACWVVCVRNKLQQWWKKDLNKRLYILKKVLRCLGKKKDLNKRLYILKKVLRCLAKKKGSKQAVLYSQKGLEMFREKKRI